MIRFILILIISLFGIGINAQTFYSEMAAQYAAEGDYEKAIEIELANSLLLKDKYGDNSIEYASSLRALTLFYIDFNYYEEALKNENKINNIIKSLYGKDNWDNVESLEIISKCLFHLKDFNKTIKLLEEILDLIKNLNGEKSLEYGVALFQLAKVYDEIGDIEKSINLIEKTKLILEEISETQTDNYINTLLELANLNFQKGKYSQTIENIKNCCKITAEIKGWNNMEYFIMLRKLSYYQSLIQDYNECLLTLQEIINKLENIIEEDNPFYLSILNDIAITYWRLGDYSKAILIGTEVLKKRKQILGTLDPDYILTLNNLATYYAAIGNYDRAIQYGLEVLKKREVIYGKNNLLYLNCLINLSVYYSDIKEYEAAFKLYQEVPNIISNIKLFHPDLIQAYLNTFFMAVDFEDWELALSSLDSAKKLCEQYLNSEHPIYAKYLEGEALYKMYEGQYEDAEKNIKKVLQILENKFGENYFEVIFTYLKATSLFFYNNKYVEFKKIISKYSPKLINYITNIFHNLPIKEKNIFWNKIIEFYNFYDFLFFYYAFNYQDKEINEIFLNNILFSKGLLLNTEMTFDQFIGDTGNEELLEKYNEIKMLRLQLNKLYEKPIAERYCDTDSLERHVNELERKLMDESSEYGDYTKNLSVTWEEVQKGLGKKDAAIEFVHFPLNQDSTMYMAYILRPEMESPAMVKLFEEKELKGVNEETLYSGVEGSKLVWEKLQSELEGVENIYFSPDGILHQIAIEYFPDYADSTRLISDRYRLNRLTSTRQIALKRDKGKTDKAIVYGGISYDTDPDIMETESRKYDRGKTRGIESYYNVADSLSGLRSGVRYLQFTMKEAENVNGLLRSGHYNPILMSGNEATEESFKSLSGTRPGIMHIATHGFYWEEEEADRQAQMNERLLFMSQFGDNARRNVEDKALTRTGLFMAGANNALSGKEISEDIDDGILTASEIANLDLRGTDLVVLSACQTGMGDIGGDGVFGLQRGFKKAGVNSILMSLWDVDDEATQILMTSFYQNYLKGMSKQVALQNAQKSVRETPGFEDPEYWAAFILLDALN